MSYSGNIEPSGLRDVSSMNAQLISPEYLMLIREMHCDPWRQLWGVGGYKYANDIAKLADAVCAKSILDYGCGVGTLGRDPAMKRFEFREYDPGVPGRHELPGPADIVVATDVLEHIEPNCLNAVLNHIASLAGKACFFTIATRKAKNYLPDGRNVHLIIENADWWLRRLKKRKNWCIEVQSINIDELSVIALMRGGSRGSG